MSKKRCSYCGKLITKDKTYCNIECENNYDKFQENASKRTGLFGIIMAIMIIMMFIGIILIAVNPQLGKIIILIAAAGTFVTMIVFPFATPETVKLLGVKKSVIIVRIIMLIMILWIFIPVILHEFTK
ncbi:DUF2116 family Zn-ribbon domain-containing protein [Clostridium sp.]|uniref:DUF2116 family Zn-ribbon domain-containing protein n=1 Tax=Clostridium sp. TaxID=1506 RepID=UPI0032167589